MIIKETKENHFSIIDRYSVCPNCGHDVCRRHSIGERRLRDLGKDKPKFIVLKYSKHICKKCNYIFVNPKINSLAIEKSRFTLDVIRLAIREKLTSTIKYRELKKYLWDNYHVKVPIPTLNTWVHLYEEDINFRQKIDR